MAVRSIVTALLVVSMALVTGVERLASADTSDSTGEFTALTPNRVLDTRHGIGTGGVVGPLGPRSSIDVQITGRGGVPAVGVDAVVMNVTAVGPTAWTFLTVYPTGIPLPNISNLNTTTGHTQANLVTVRVGGGGMVTVYNWDGTPHVLFDVAGYYTDEFGPDGARFRAIDPVRIADTRHGSGGIGATPFGPDESRSIRATGYGGVPVTGPTAVVLNVTVDAATAWSFLTVSPADVARPIASNLNYVAGDTVANQVIVRVPADGMIDIYNAFGTTTVIVDLVGYYEDAGSENAGRFWAFNPYRAFDTRVDGIFPPPGNLWDGDYIWYGWVDDPFAAAVVNVTVTETSGGGYIVTYPYPGDPPNTSTVNYGTGDTVANHAIVRCGPSMAFLNVRGTTHLIVDVFGVFTTDNPAPVITSDGGGDTATITVSEEQTFVTDVEAIDDTHSEGDGLYYGLSGGEDAGWFSIDEDTGVLTFDDPPDFESPSDTDGDNEYHVDVTVVDFGARLDTQAITVVVADDAPVITSDGGGDTATVTVVENATSPGNFVWAAALGGAGNDQGEGVAIDGLGNVFTTGAFTGMVDFDPGPATFNLTSAGGTDVFVTKFDGAGNFLWAAAVGGPSNDEGRDVAVDGSGNVVTTGYFQGTADFDPGPSTSNLVGTGSWEVFVLKLDGGGNFLWAAAMGGISGDFGKGVAVDGSGNVHTTGQFYGTADFDPGPGTFNLTAAGRVDVFVSKLDSAGNFVWAAAMGGAGEDSGSGVAVDGSGNVLTAGSFELTADFDPGPGTFDLTATPGPQYMPEEAFVAKLDSAGTLVWARAMGGPGRDRASGVAVDGSGNVLSTGSFQGPADFDPGLGTFELTAGVDGSNFVSKLDSGGDFVWAKKIGGSGAGDIASDDRGNVHSTGSGVQNGTMDFDPGADTFNLTAHGYYDLYASTLDGSGGFTWAANVGGAAGHTFGNSIAADANGVVIGGHFDPTIDLQSGPATWNFTSAGGNDVFVAKVQMIGGHVTKVASSDSDGSTDTGGGLSYSLTAVNGGGADNGRFTLDADSGLLNFTSPADFENPSDADADNNYEVQVTVTDTGGLTDTQDITVTVTDIAD